MSNNLAIFDFENFKIRTIVNSFSNEIMYVARDIAVALDYKNTKNAISYHCKQTISVAEYTKLLVSNSSNQIKNLIEDLNQLQPQTILIPRRDVFTLVNRSNKPNAIEFQDWVYKVVESVINTGSYNIQSNTNNINNLPVNIAQVLQSIVTQNELLTKKLEKIENSFSKLKKSIPIIQFKHHNVIRPFAGFDVATLVEFANNHFKTKITIRDGYDYLISLELTDPKDRYRPTAYGLKTNAVNIISTAFPYEDERVGVTQKLVINRDFAEDFVNGLYQYTNYRKLPKLTHNSNISIN